MKNKHLRKGLIFFCLVLMCMLHLPFGFGKSAAWDRPFNLIADMPVAESRPAEISAAGFSLLYQQLNLGMLGLSQEAYQFAMKGMATLKQQGKIHNARIISIIDFTRSSASKRLFVIDLENERLLFNTYVAHGQNSGTEFATRFSNKPESFQSSLGFYETAGTYIGKNGYSLQLKGLEKGFNDLADERAIVMHGAPYVSENYIHSQGYIGRSWGCPAVPEKQNKPIIDKIKNGTCLFIYAGNKTYSRKSKILNS